MKELLEVVAITLISVLALPIVIVLVIKEFEYLANKFKL